jgi:Tetratricopeptide repeat
MRLSEYRIGVRLLVPGLAIWLMLPSGVCVAKDVDDAEEDAKLVFKQGVELFHARKFDEAAAVFEKAYSLKPIYKLLFNIGQAYASSRKYDLAMQSFERYLVDGGDDISDERREEVLKEIAKLRPLVGFLDMTAPDGLELRIDGKSRGTTPIRGKIMLTVGNPHTFELLRDDKIVYEQEVRVYGGVVESVTVTPEDVGGEEPGPSEQSAPADDDYDEPKLMLEEEKGTSTLKVAGWVTIGSGAALAVAGGIVGGLALSQSSKLEEACPGGGCSPSRTGEIDSLDSMALASDILLGVGAAALAAGAVMLIVSRVKETRSESETGTELVLVPTPFGITANIRF